MQATEIKTEAKQDECVYHAVPLSVFEKVMSEGLRPMLSDATQDMYPKAKPLTHACDDLELLNALYGQFLYDSHGPFHIISAPRKYFAYHGSDPDEPGYENPDGEDSSVEFNTFYSDQHIPANELKHETDWNSIDNYGEPYTLSSDVNPTWK